MKDLAKNLEGYDKDVNGLKDGIPVKKYFVVNRVFKKSHPAVTERMLDTLDLPLYDKGAVVDWHDFLRI